MDQPAITLPQAYDHAVADCEVRKFAEAEQRCNQIVAANPDYFDAIYLLAVVQLRQEKYQAALINFDRALALRPGFSIVHCNRGNALHALNRHDEALACFDRAIELQPDMATAYSDRGAVSHAQD
jgi:tetratricopeptide (TPR) repeat protein